MHLTIDDGRTDEFPAMIMDGKLYFRSNKPVSNATVFLSGSATGTGITDANGTVTIRLKTTGVGAITATVTKPGYLSTGYNAFLTVIHTPPEYIAEILTDVAVVLAIILTPPPNQWLAIVLTTYLLIWKFLPRIHVKFDDLPAFVFWIIGFIMCLPFIWTVFCTVTQPLTLTIPCAVRCSGFAIEVDAALAIGLYLLITDGGKGE